MNQKLRISVFFLLVTFLLGGVSAQNEDEKTLGLEAKPAQEELSQPTTDFGKKVLEQHNLYRGIAGIPLMRWNPTIAASAQNWANRLKSYQNCNMQHSSNSLRSNIASFRYIGENLYWYYNSGGAQVSGQSGIDATDAWYSEIADFQYSARGVVCPKRGKRDQIGHFTQLMWDKSTHLGCGAASCGNSVVVVCQYGPGGNFNMRTNAPFSEEAAARLNSHPLNKKFGGLPRCDR